MAEWRIQLFGPLIVRKDGKPVKLRTRHQALLLARLAVFGTDAIGREKTAELLWPNANRDNALAYLRRALKELRDLGLDIRTEGPNLRLTTEVRLERHDRSAPGRGLPPRFLEGIDGAVADELRGIVRRKFSAATPVLEAAPALAPDAIDPYAALGRALVDRDPSGAATLLLAAWPAIHGHVSPERLLALLQKLLKAIDEDDPRRSELVMHVAWSAYMVTRIGLAERLWHDALAARALRHLANVAADECRWAEASEHADRAVALAEGTQDGDGLATALYSRGRLRWRTLRLPEAVADYQSCDRLITGTEHERTLRPHVRMILVFLRAALGQEVGPLPPSSDAEENGDGFTTVVEASTRFWVAFESGDRETAAVALSRRMEASVRGEMERDFIYSLEAAACFFGHFGRAIEAAAALRLASRVRRQTGTRRAPAERLLLRRHVAPPYFGSPIEGLAESWISDDPVTISRRITRELCDV